MPVLRDECLVMIMSEICYFLPVQTRIREMVELVTCHPYKKSAASFDKYILRILSKSLKWHKINLLLKISKAMKGHDVHFWSVLQACAQRIDLKNVSKLSILLLSG